MQDPNGPPPEVSGGTEDGQGRAPPNEVHLPGGGRLACGQLVEGDGSQPVGVLVVTGTVGLSATMPHVQVVTFDVTNHRLTRLSFRPGQEYLLTLESDPNHAKMSIDEGPTRFIALHLWFGPGP